MLLPPAFQGIAYRLADNWRGVIPEDFKEKPIKYLEIGAFCGANIFSVEKLYGTHPDTVLTCIDPWIDYDDYEEYKGEQPSIYQCFKNNTESIKQKLNVIRGFSHEQVYSLPDEHFDLIYIDGNHEPEYVLEDAVLCFRKLKVGGYMIFDDYGWGGPDRTQKGIDGFLMGYFRRIKVLGERKSQVFIKKLH